VSINQPGGRVRPGNEKAPLLSQRRLFRSLGGFTNGLSSPFGLGSPESSGGYQEFGSGHDVTQSYQSSSSTTSTRTLDTFAGVFCPVTVGFIFYVIILLSNLCMILALHVQCTPLSPSGFHCRECWSSLDAGSIRHCVRNTHVYCFFHLCYQHQRGCRRRRGLL